MLSSILTNTIKSLLSKAKYKTPGLRQPVCVCMCVRVQALWKEMHDHGLSTVKSNLTLG